MDGKDVGYAVGSQDSDDDGHSVRSQDGLKVGPNVDEAVGSNDGLSDDGPMDGKSVGSQDEYNVE